MNNIASYSDFELLLEKSEQTPVLLYKHSVSCPICSMARVEIDHFLETNKIPTYILVIQETGDLKNQIANELGATHESPQVLLINNRKVQEKLNHTDITSDNLVDIAKV